VPIEKVYKSRKQEQIQGRKKVEKRRCMRSSGETRRQMRIDFMSPNDAFGESEVRDTRKHPASQANRASSIPKYSTRYMDVEGGKIALIGLLS
jgi:hypothetical protein